MDEDEDDEDDHEDEDEDERPRWGRIGTSTAATHFNPL
jgi:hypothetical protein